MSRDIEFHDGIHSQNDMIVRMLPGAAIEFKDGVELYYKGEMAFAFKSDIPGNMVVVKNPIGAGAPVLMNRDPADTPPIRNHVKAVNKVWACYHKDHYTGIIKEACSEDLCKEVTSAIQLLRLFQDATRT